MKAVNLNNVSNYIADTTPGFGNKDFNDSANYLWRDNLDFNIFDGEGYLTDKALTFIESNREELIKFKKDGTWADAILSYAEFRELGYQCDKAPKKRSDVKFSGSMLMNAYLIAEEEGRDFRPVDSTYSSNDLAGYTDGIDLVEMATENSYRTAHNTKTSSKFFEAAQKALDKRTDDDIKKGSLTNKGKKSYAKEIELTNKLLNNL